jgi:hypothetical protein
MEFDAIKKQLEKDIVSPVVQFVRNFTIRTGEDLGKAGTYLIAIKERKAHIEEKLGTPKKKAYEAYKATCDVYNECMKPLDNAESEMKRKMAVYQEQKQKEAQEAQAKLEVKAVKAEEKGKFDKAEEIRSTVVQVDAPKVDGISYTTVWKYEITDEKAIPREYLMVNEKAISGVVKATKGSLSIPGVRIFSTKQVSARV